MSVAGVPVSPGSRTVGLRGANQQVGRVYREVESTGVSVTVAGRGYPTTQIAPIRHDETWYERMVREGKVRRAAGEWVPSARR